MKALILGGVHNLESRTCVCGGERDSVVGWKKRKPNEMSLTLFQAQGILSDVIEYQKGVTVCDVCHRELKGDTYLICDAPVNLPDGKMHDGHTACSECVDTRDYVGEKGACIVCMRSHTGGTRSSVQKSGIAKIPAIRNRLATAMIEGIRDAEAKVDALAEQNDLARIQEGTDRRIAHVEEVRRKKEEAEEKMLLAQKEAEEKLLVAQKEAEEKLLAAQKEAEEKVLASQQEAEEKVLASQQEADKKIKATQKEAAKKIKATQKEAEKNTSVEPIAKRRKYTMDEESIRKRTERAKETRAKNKQKMESYDKVVQELEDERHHKNYILQMAKTMLGDHENFGEFMKAIHDGDEYIECID